MLNPCVVATRRDSSPRYMRATAAIAAALIAAATLVGCSSEIVGDVSGQSAQQETATSEGDGSSAEGATDDGAPGANSSGGGVFAGIPVIDGESTHNLSGTESRGKTDWRDIGIATGLAWQEAADQARGQLTDAGLTELGWGATDSAQGRINAHGVYEHGEVLLQLEINEEGDVSYEAREIPAESFAEKQFACKTSQVISVAASTFTLMAAVSGDTVTQNDIDFTFAYSDALKDRLPADVSTALVSLQKASGQAVGLPVEQLGPGTDVAEAISGARGVLDDATKAYCSA